MRGLLLVICFVFTSLCHAQTGDPVQHSELVTFLDSLDARDTMKINNISSANGLNDVLEDTIRFFHDSLFSNDDKAFMRKQLAMYRGKEWTDSDHITGITVIPQPTINAYAINGEAGWKKFRKKYGDGYKVISFPLFTIDKNMAIVARSYHVLRVTTGRLILFKKLKGRWQEVKTYTNWKG